MEDTPVAKRARQNADQDVGDARRNSGSANASVIPGTQSITTPGSGTKRLGHVQVSPRLRSSASASSIKLEVDSPCRPQAQVQDQAQAQTQAQDQDQPTQSGESDVKPSSEPTHSTPSRSFAERVILTPRSILSQLKSLKEYLFRPPTPFRPSIEEKLEISQVLSHIGVHVLDAEVSGEQGE